MSDKLKDFLLRGMAAQHAVDALGAGPRKPDRNGVEYKHERCAHIRRGELPAISRVQHATIPGAPTRSDLATETELCAICSGVIAATLIRLESSGVA